MLREGVGSPKGARIVRAASSARKPAVAAARRAPYPARTMTFLAHLTGHDVGLVASLLFLAVFVAGLGLRWLEQRQRR